MFPCMSAPPTASVAWPSMRGGPANLGRARVAPEPRDWPVRVFPTGGPVFSTPVIGADEQIYVGSADCCFYRLDPESGRVVWRVETDEIIDSAACIDAEGTVWVPGGDGRIYGFDADGKELWRYDRMLDRTRVTPSTIYWWEGNVVLGPNGWLYAGNDDFYLYAIEPYQGVRWATPTGLHIWGAPAFADDRVFVPSFDRCLYALDLETGRVRWRRNLGNFMASSPAVAEGLVILGSFDHHVIAVDAEHGEVVWRTATGGPVYASVAIDDDQVVVGSADGVVYALDLRSGAVRWTRWLGDAIRGSVAVGEHLYVPGGDGWLTALERDGAVKWRHDTRRPDTLCNLNASVALGRHGLATASASGDIVYVPWGAVPDAPPAEPEPDGVRLVVCSPTGAAGAPVGPGDTVGVRVLHSKGGSTLPGHILSANAPLCPDGSQVNVKAEPGKAVRVCGRYAVGGAEHEFDQELEIPWVESREGPLSEGFRATRLSVQAPSIVPSFDQIGLASLSIDIGILKREGEQVIRLRRHLARRHPGAGVRRVPVRGDRLPDSAAQPASGGADARQRAAGRQPGGRDRRASGADRAAVADTVGRLGAHARLVPGEAAPVGPGHTGQHRLAHPGAASRVCARFVQAVGAAGRRRQVPRRRRLPGGDLAGAREHARAAGREAPARTRDRALARRRPRRRAGHPADEGRPSTALALLAAPYHPA